MNSRSMFVVVALAGFVAEGCGYEEGEIDEATQALTPRRDLAVAYDKATDAGAATADVANPSRYIIAAGDDIANPGRHIVAAKKDSAAGLLVADINYDASWQWCDYNKSDCTACGGDWLCKSYGPWGCRKYGCACGPKYFCD